MIAAVEFPRHGMKNITLTLDEKITAWLRLQAAKRGMSVSRFVGDLVHERMREARGYDEAMRRFLSHAPLDFEWADGHRPAREEINNRRAARDDLARPTTRLEEPK